MGRHALREKPGQRAHAGHVMLGGVVERGLRWAHWVPIGAEPVRYRHGTAHRAACGVPCVPAGAEYLEQLQACPDCDQRERGFSHRVCCEVTP
jgi:hypothetical protein